MIYQVELPANAAQQRPIRVVQCSDMHLFVDPTSRLLGLNTQHSFEKVVDLIQQQQPHIDLLLSTGDIAQQSTEQTYQRFLQSMQAIDAAHFCIPGNHDLDQPYYAGLALNQLPCEILIGGWCFILLNSTTDHEISGSLSAESLQYLQEALKRQHDKYVVIALHHNPVAVGCAWLDQHMLKTCQTFFETINPFDNVKLVLNGHVHQVFEHIHNNVQYLSCPSTSLQFQPNSDQFKLDTANPGYRWLDFYADGHVETQVCRLEDFDFSIDYQSTGY